MARPGLRVVTYNILADQYASREHAQKVLFGYCPKRCGPFCFADCANAASFGNGLLPFGIQMLLPVVRQLADALLSS